MPQQVFNLEGHDHPQASPLGTRVGPLFSSGAITGKELPSGAMPSDAETQAKNAFVNMRSLLAKAGMSVDDVAKLTLYITDEKYREVAIKHWALAFPDPNRRPTRRTLIAPIHVGVIQVEIIAYKE